MEKVDFQYGLMGYFFKYLGGIAMLLMLPIFAGLPVLFAIGGAAEKALLEFILLLAIFIPMTVLLSKAAYYCFRYANVFTKRFSFTEQGVYVTDAKHTYGDLNPLVIKRITYRRLLKLFVIECENHESFIIMNNGFSLTQQFCNVREFLLSHPTLRVKWF